MPEPKPTPEGATLRFFRFAEGLAESQLGKPNGLAEQTIGRLENGKGPLPVGRIVKLLSPWKVPREAIETALLALEISRPPADPGAPTAPTAGERLALQAAAVAAGTASLRATRTVLTRESHRRHARRHRRWAQKTWARLARLPEKPQEAEIEALLGEPKSWALAERLAWASEPAAADRASEALRLARLSLRVVAASPGPELWLLRLRGALEPFHGNALRVSGDLPASEASFDLADDCWKRGAGGDPGQLLDGRRPLDLKASLLRQRGRFDEAIQLLDRALAASPPKAAARLLIKKAATYIRAGEYKLALEVLDQAEPKIDEWGERRLLLVHRFSRANSLCHLDRYADAEALLPLVDTLTAELGNELDKQRTRWLLGRTCRGLNRWVEALAALSKVRAYFRDKQIAYDYALASLEVAEIYLEQGQTRLVQALAEEMLWLFNGQKVHKEALAALTLFCRAAEADVLEPEWTRHLIKYLYRAQYKPELRFEP